MPTQRSYRRRWVSTPPPPIPSLHVSRWHHRSLGNASPQIRFTPSTPSPLHNLAAHSQLDVCSVGSASKIGNRSCHCSHFGCGPGLAPSLSSLLTSVGLGGSPAVSPCPAAKWPLRSRSKCSLSSLDSARDSAHKGSQARTLPQPRGLFDLVSQVGTAPQLFSRPPCLDPDRSVPSALTCFSGFVLAVPSAGNAVPPGLGVSTHTGAQV